MLVLIGGFSTQFASTIARKALQRQNDHLKADKEYADECDRAAPGLVAAIAQKTQPDDASQAVDSYLSQVVGAWTSFGLAIGTCALMGFRMETKRGTIPSGVVLLIAFAIIVILLAIMVRQPFGGERLSRYYKHKGLIPPLKVALTWMRIFFFLFYAILVFGLYWPDWNANSTSLASPAPTNALVATHH